MFLVAKHYIPMTVANVASEQVFSSLGGFNPIPVAAVYQHSEDKHVYIGQRAASKVEG